VAPKPSAPGKAIGVSAAEAVQGSATNSANAHPMVRSDRLDDTL
jgi:hypothetical protein